MSDGTTKFSGQIISKKAKAIDQEPSRKKNKKNKKRQQFEEEDQVKYKQQQIKQLPRNCMKHSVKNKKHDQARIFQEISSIFSTYKATTIRQVLQDCSYDKDQATNRLCDMKPDGQDDKEKEDWSKDLEKLQTQSGDTSHPSSQIANNLMNEVFDNFEEINGRQFQQLFEQIAEMIKDDQESCMGVLQINSFVDQCYTIKQTLLVGFREQLSNFEDFHFDQSYPLYTQTQQFLYELLNKQAQQQKRREEDFPTLGGGKNSKRNIVDRIRQEERKKKQETTLLFAPSKNCVPQFARERNNELSIFNVDNKLKSQKDMLSLHKQFSDMPIQDLKFVYKTFVADYNICREFLIKYYDSKRNARVYEIRPANSLPKQPSRKVYASRLTKQKVDQQLKHLSLQQLRQEIDHLYKLKQALQLTKMKIHSANQKLQLDRMINEKMPIIAKLSQASRLILVQRMTKANPLYIDLHGYRQEEIFPLLSRISDMIVDEFDRGNDKIRLRRVKGKQTACLTVMTGKGLHSQGNKSILKPTIFDWCRDKDFDYEENDDHVKVYVGVDR